MNRQLLACLALAAALLPSSAGAQERRATVSPWLLPLAERQTTAIPRILRTPLGGNQGRHRLGGREALSLHLRTTATREELEALGAHVRTLIHDLATVTLLPEDLPALAADPRVLSIALPQPLEPVLEKSLPDTGIPPLRTLSGGTFTGATGAGVIVGVFDSGIDVDHPNFKNAQGKTRILYLWDQATDEECTSVDIDAGLCAQQDSIDAAGHGTHVTGIAAGNGAAPDGNGASWTHVGVAPESSIIFVKMDPDSFAAIEALEYIFHKANQLGLPAVVNLSISSDLGPHDGSAHLEKAIDYLVTAKPGRAVVVAAGNSRAREIHAEVKAKAGLKVTGPVFNIPAFTPKPEAGDDIVVVTGYYPETDDITVTLISPSGESYVRSLDFEECSPEIPGIDGTVQICNTEVSNLSYTTSAREILIGIYDSIASQPPKTGNWKIYVTGNTVAGSGEVDFWMASDLETENGTRARFTTLVDSYETVGTPGTSREAITVGAHITRLCWEDFTGTPRSYSGNDTLGEIAWFSGFGPTRDGRQKPELSAPGMGQIAPLADEVKDALIDAGAGPAIINDFYQVMRGTSMSAPHVAGAVALLLQQNPTATNATLRSLLASKARDDAFTRLHDSLFLNPAFGSGKLDLGRWGFKDVHETNDLASQAWAALSGQLFEGYIERAADVDYFFLQGMQGGDTVHVTLNSLPQDYALALQARQTTFDNCSWGGTSTKASSNQAGTTSESITYTAPSGIQPGLVGPAAYIRVASSAGATSSADTYQLKAILTRPETTGTHNSTATAQELPAFVEMKVAGAVSGSSGDFYAFDIKQGKTIVLEAPGRAITLRDPNGALVTTEIGALTYTVPSGGFFPSTKTYYVSIAGGSLGPYTLTLKIQ